MSSSKLREAFAIVHLGKGQLQYSKRIANLKKRSTKTIKNAFETFKAAHVSGPAVLNDAAVTTLAILFDKVYLPCDLGLVRAFSQKFMIRIVGGEDHTGFQLETHEYFRDMLPVWDMFADLPEPSRTTAHLYLQNGIGFAIRYAPLFGEVFESDLFTTHPQIWTKGEEAATVIRIIDDEGATFTRHIECGYVPIVSGPDPEYRQRSNLDKPTADQLTALLAMESVKLVLPSMRAAHPEVILEAREKLKDQLPPFWASMLKLSTELRARVKECRTGEEILREGKDLVQTVVRPSLIDLNAKLKKERRDWFYKILSSVYKGIKLLIGNPPLTHYEFDIIDKSGRETKVEVNAATGEIIESAQELWQIGEEPQEKP